MDDKAIFDRQRRNLVLISFCQLFLLTTNADIEKISLLGTEIKLGNPSVILFWGIILSAYFLFRYNKAYNTLYAGHDFKEARNQDFLIPLLREFFETEHVKEYKRNHVLEIKLSGELRFPPVLDKEIQVAYSVYDKDKNKTLIRIQAITLSTAKFKSLEEISVKNYKKSIWSTEYKFPLYFGYLGLIASIFLLLINL